MVMKKGIHTAKTFLETLAIDTEIISHISDRIATLSFQEAGERTL